MSTGEFPEKLWTRRVMPQQFETHQYSKSQQVTIEMESLELIRVLFFLRMEER